ncbi:MAG: spore coat protein [Bacilli bacterium]
MQEKDYFEGILTSVKLSADLLMHGALESSTDEINDTFIKCEKNILEIQHEIFNIMKDNNWYKMENIKESEINKALKKQEET